MVPIKQFEYGINFNRLFRSIDKRICSTQFVGHLDVIRSICYIPDLDYLVSGGKDKMIKIWNLGR